MFLKKEKIFVKELFESRKKNIYKIMQTEFAEFDEEFALEKLKKIIDENSNPFSFFTSDEIEKIKVNSVFSDELIWKWCLVYSILQYNFLDGFDKKGFRLRDTNSQTLKKILVDFPIADRNSKKLLIEKIRDLDITKKYERIVDINVLYEFMSIKNEGFLDDPLFKKGFLATMLFNEIKGSNEFQEGPCIDYHILNIFTSLINPKNKSIIFLDIPIFEKRLILFYLILKLNEKFNYSFKKIDNALFGYSRSKNRLIFECENTTWY